MSERHSQVQEEEEDPLSYNINEIFEAFTLNIFKKEVIHEHPLSETSSKTKHGGALSKVLERTKFLKRNIVKL